MRLSTFSISSLLAVSPSGLMVLSPSNAQTSSESEGRELGAFALGAGTINPGMTPATTLIPLGPRGAAFLGVAGLAVPITTGLRAAPDHH